MLKTILKIIVVLIILFFIALFAIPYFFEDQIKAKIAEAINEKVDAKVTFSDVDLSLIKSFPSANVSLDQLVIINKAPFEGDTLVSLGEVDLKMSIKELFKGKEEAINIDGITSKNGLINIIFNKDGIGNYDIAKKNKENEKGGKSESLSLKIENYNNRFGASLPWPAYCQRRWRYSVPVANCQTAKCQSGGCYAWPFA